MKTKIISLFILTLCCFVYGFSQEISLSHQLKKGYFPLADNNSKFSAIVTDPSDFKVVQKAASALQQDIFEGTNFELPIREFLSAYPVIVGTIDHSKFTIQTVNIHSESESRQWKENVVRGYADGKKIVTTNNKEPVLKIYFPEPGLVINTIEIE
jgi:hypothetical protein